MTYAKPSLATLQALVALQQAQQALSVVQAAYQQSQLADQIAANTAEITNLQAASISTGTTTSQPEA